jgi:Flp pilus assembly protein TadD
MRRDLLISFGLVVMTAAIYAGVRNAEFVYFDDGGYVYFNGGEFVQQNPHVCDGLTPASVAWAFTVGTDPEHQANWHPLTWLSHMLDVEMFGVAGDKWGLPASGWHHLSGLALHLANTVLLFLVLNSLSGAAWPSAAVAALFALHPLHVESVAWVSERKDVLSTFFALLAIGAYGAYARRPGLGRYALVFLCLALGLMAKPMLVTLPFLLLLLDYWPLERVPFEKRQNSSSAQNNPSPLMPRQAARAAPASRHERRRIARAARRAAIPASPPLQPRSWSWLVLEKLPLLALSAVSSYITFVVQRESAAWVAVEDFPLASRVENALLACVGYLGKTFWPTGLAVLYPLPQDDLDLGAAMAAAGLLLAISAAVCWAAWRGRRYLAVGWFWYLGMLVPVIGLVQVGNQSMADRYTYLPLVGLFVMAAWGAADLAASRPYRRPALAIVAGAVLLPCMWLTHRQTAYWANSECLFRHALDVTAENFRMQSNLGNVLTWQGRKKEAVREYLKALAIKPRDPEAHNNLANTLKELRRTDDALQHYRAAIDCDPGYVDAHYNLANTLRDRGELDEAAVQYHEALRLRPGYADAYAGLARISLVRGKAEDAVRLAEYACQLTGRRQPELLNVLAAAYDQAGRFDQAAATAREAIPLAASAGRADLAAEIQKRLRLSEAHRPSRAGGK